jgi:DNA-binding XRE family transcriptional regulator
MEARRRGRPRRPSGQGFDRYVGGRIRERRMTLGLTQQELADRLGITCQQP